MINTITMKKIIFALLASILIPTVVSAWSDCPVGEPCESECELLVDTDNDGICDHSQPAPENRAVAVLDSETEEELHDLIGGRELKETKTVAEVAQVYEIDATEYAEALSEYYGVDVKSNDAFQLLHDDYAIAPSVAKDIAILVKTGQEIVEGPESSSNRSGRTYHLLSISLPLIALYLIGCILLKKKIISPVTHRKFWNILLLISFLISGILGILSVIRINFNTPIRLPFNILLWHVEAGIAMTVISVFHALWHWAYFKNLFIIKKRKKNIS